VSPIGIALPTAVVPALPMTPVVLAVALAASERVKVLLPMVTVSAAGLFTVTVPILVRNAPPTKMVSVVGVVKFVAFARGRW